MLNNCTNFSSFYVLVSFYPNLPKSKQCNLFPKHFWCIISFCDTDFEILPKVRLVLNFLDFETHFCAKIQVWISNLGPSWKLSNHGELCFWMTIQLVSWIKILIVIYLWKVLFIISFIDTQTLNSQQQGIWFFPSSRSQSKAWPLCRKMRLKK